MNNQLPIYLSLDKKHYLNESQAIIAIAHALRLGHLSILLGAGVSKSVNKKFPSWLELVRQISKSANTKFDDNKKDDNSYLLKTIEKIRTDINDNKKYIDNITNVLYENVEYNNLTLELKLLNAIGSIMRISINKNSREFINFNFDDLFEWYLEYYGYNIQIVSSPTSLIGDAKSIIYHPHGFLPKKEKFKKHKSNSLTFSLGEYDKAMKLNNDWTIILQRIFTSKIILMIGLSGEDSHIRSMCRHIYEDVIRKKRLLGFILLPKTTENEEMEKVHLEIGLVHLYVEHDHLAEKILHICRMSQDIIED